jgi:hypothetical protein
MLHSATLSMGKHQVKKKDSAGVGKKKVKMLKISGSSMPLEERDTRWAAVKSLINEILAVLRSTFTNVTNLYVHEYTRSLRMWLPFERKPRLGERNVRTSNRLLAQIMEALLAHLVTRRSAVREAIGVGVFAQNVHLTCTCGPSINLDTLTLYGGGDGDDGDDDVPYTLPSAPVMAARPSTGYADFDSNHARLVESYQPKRLFDEIVVGDVLSGQFDFFQATSVTASGKMCTLKRIKRTSYSAGASVHCYPLYPFRLEEEHEHVRRRISERANGEKYVVVGADGDLSHWQGNEGNE